MGAWVIKHRELPLCSPSAHSLGEGPAPCREDTQAVETATRGTEASCRELALPSLASGLSELP